MDDREHWWRGCKLDIDQIMGCTQHPYTDHTTGQEYLVDECVCNANECNRDMQPFTIPTTQGKELEIYDS